MTIIEQLDIRMEDRVFNSHCLPCLMGFKNDIYTDDTTVLNIHRIRQVYNDRPTELHLCSDLFNK